MKTPLLTGLSKQAATLELLIPGSYGYFMAVRRKGMDPADVVLRGAVLGGGLGTLSSVRDVWRGDVDLDTLVSPIRGAVLGGAASLGGRVFLPLLLTKKNLTRLTASARKALDKAKETIRSSGGAK